ncbi:glycerol-3-phosphate acyltransferase [Bacillus sp. Marseille-Q1617]|uniref:glycerol-3-phosphate acyltransferase n=1 Tax=Bacillus sp. Marseille-Q1617 TaxID=2736887 RepID=UPI0020CA8196|nr:glycerol-3-phosphate acyltransferase [Bacillus sp. Marseille-Q1617]
MDIIILYIVIMVLSYLAGSVTGAYYIVMLYTGQDVRELESGNVGATNAARIMGKKGFLLTLLIDAAKVFFTLFIVQVWLVDSAIALVISSVLLCIGHLFPIQLGFRGGKGVVVYLASALFISPISIGAAAGVMGTSYGLFRRYKTSGFLSMASIPFTAFLIEDSFIVPFGLLFLFCIVVISHFK